MSGIYIPSMAMPESCSLCQLKTVVGLDREKCLVSGVEFYSWDAGWGAKQRRHESCPLVPVPEHGRLIEADRIELYMQDEWMNNELSNGDWILFRERLNETPTIIPADKEGEG